jgi:hypothetical protein
MHRRAFVRLLAAVASPKATALELLSEQSLKHTPKHHQFGSCRPIHGSDARDAGPIRVASWLSNRTNALTNRPAQRTTRLCAR